MMTQSGPKPISLSYTKPCILGVKLEHNLLNPFQCRLNGVNIRECPHILDFAIDDDSHTLSFPGEDLKIPISLNGIVLFFPSRRPTKEEHEQCLHIELTAAEPEWNPHDSVYSKGESAMTWDDGNILGRLAPNICTREIMGM
jgi:hypothetical protein